MQVNVKKAKKGKYVVTHWKVLDLMCMNNHMEKGTKFFSWKNVIDDRNILLIYFFSMLSSVLFEMVMLKILII